MVRLSEKTVSPNPTDGVSDAKAEADGAATENGGAATHKAAGAPRLPPRPRLESDPGGQARVEVGMSELMVHVVELDRRRIPKKGVWIFGTIKRLK